MKVWQFIKTNSYDIFKMNLNQIGLSIFAFVMSLATYRNDKLFFISGLISIAVYLYLLYTMTYEIGRKDKPAVDAGRKKPLYAKGFLISLCANALNIILVVALVISSFCLVENKNYVPQENTEVSDTAEADSADSGVRESFSTEEDTNRYETNAASYINAASHLLIVLFQAMYITFKEIFFSKSELIYLVFPIPALITCTISYIMALKGKRILFFLPERPHKPKNR